MGETLKLYFRSNDRDATLSVSIGGQEVAVDLPALTHDAEAPFVVAVPLCDECASGICHTLKTSKSDSRKLGHPRK